MEGFALQAFIDRSVVLLARFLTAPVPTVAALNGHAFGWGAMFALAHDQRVQRADRGWLCLPEVDLGLQFHPLQLSLIQAKLSPAAVAESILAGRRWDAEAALAAGVVDGPRRRSRPDAGRRRPRAGPLRQGPRHRRRAQGRPLRRAPSPSARRASAGEGVVRPLDDLERRAGRGRSAMPTTSGWCRSPPMPGCGWSTTAAAVGAPSAGSCSSRLIRGRRRCWRAARRSAPRRARPGSRGPRPPTPRASSRGWPVASASPWSIGKIGSSVPWKITVGTAIAPSASMRDGAVNTAMECALFGLVPRAASSAACSR